MPGTIAENAARILEFLARDPGRNQFEGPQIAEATGLSPDDINDAVAILVENGYAEWLKFLGTSPYEFGVTYITPRGRYERERLATVPVEPLTSRSTTSPVGALPVRPPSPIGSPYGFTDEDWEMVAARKGEPDRLYVVLGLQFDSAHYDSTELKANVKSMFETATAEYNSQPNALAVELAFTSLGAAYGEHLFNEIARDIISADIAVFDTSDLNPNVMLEMGVALTWGVRVLPIKKQGTPKPPSDVSGQTWADHTDSGRFFPDPDHSRKVVRMVERAARKKQRS